MDRVVAVLYKGSLALYNLSGGEGGVYNAQLTEYHGLHENEPPHNFSLHKEGRHWSDKETTHDLLDDLGSAIDELQGNDADIIGQPLKR